MFMIWVDGPFKRPKHITCLNGGITKMSTSTIHFIRQISTSSANYGKRNFRMISLYNKRGMRAAKEARAKNPKDEYLMVNKRGLKETGYKDKWNRFHQVPERIPELIVPDLKGFTLKPYVTYQTEDMEQPKFTAALLFNEVYANKIIQDFDNGKLNEDGSSKEPSENEKLTPQQAKDNAAKTGTDIFTNGDLRPSWLYC